MPAKKKDDAPKAPAKATEKPKVDSSVTAPMQPNPSSPEAIALDPEDVKNVAVQLALANGERRPFAMHIGRPMWKRWEHFAQAGLMAAAYLEAKRNAE